MKLVRYADRPDLEEIRHEVLTQTTFPEYLNHNVPGNLYWGRLYDEHPDFQLALLDGDGTRRGVPLGADAVGRDRGGPSVGLGRGVPPCLRERPPCGRPVRARAVRQAGPAVARPVGTHARGDEKRGEGRRAQRADRACPADAQGELSADPDRGVRRVASSGREALRSLDPRPRAHRRHDPRAGSGVDESRRARRRVAGVDRDGVPGDGDHVVPGMLAPLVVRDGTGVHVEPNVWLRHAL